MTPVQAYQILIDKQSIDESKYLFWLEQFRLANFFTVKSSMGDTKSIREPHNLYKFNHEKNPFKNKEVSITDSDRKMIESLLRMQNN